MMFRIVILSILIIILAFGYYLLDMNIKDLDHMNKTINNPKFLFIEPKLIKFFYDNIDIGKYNIKQFNRSIEKSDELMSIIHFYKLEQNFTTYRLLKLVNSKISEALNSFNAISSSSDASFHSKLVTYNNNKTNELRQILENRIKKFFNEYNIIRHGNNFSPYYIDNNKSINDDIYDKFNINI